MSLTVAGAREEVPVGTHERQFEDFLRAHELHCTQSVAGLGWVNRNVSYSDRYSHSAALDVVNPALRALLPNMMGQRGIFRFMFPPRQAEAQQEPHLVISNRQMRVPDLELLIPTNPSLHLDIAGFLLLAKGRAHQFLNQHEVPATAHNVTTLLAIWFALSDEQEQPRATNSILGQPPLTFGRRVEVAHWLREEAPAYLLLHKFASEKDNSQVSLSEAIAAKGIPAHRLAALYPPAAQDQHD